MGNYNELERCERCGKLTPEIEITPVEIGGEEFTTCRECLDELVDAGKIVIL